jgi:hypothetical protein
MLNDKSVKKIEKIQSNCFQTHVSEFLKSAAERSKIYDREIYLLNRELDIKMTNIFSFVYLSHKRNYVPADSIRNPVLKICS